MPYIYKITNDINDKIYVGKTLYTIEKRWREHRRDYLQRRYENRPLYAAMRKYGIEHFSINIVEEIFNINIINDREIYWIEYFDSFNNGYNATKGGEGSVRANYQLIYDLYINQQLSYKQIKELTGYDTVTIQTALLSYNITKEDIKQNAIKRNSKAVVQIDIKTNKVIASFPNCAAAQEAMTNGASCHSGSHISAVCRKKRKTAYGYKWEYYQ